MSLAGRRFVGLSLLGLVAVVGCTHEPAVVETPPVEVVVAQPVSEKIEDWDVYTGTVESKEMVDIRARVRGHIQSVPFTEGEEIVAGTDLFILDSEPFKADLGQAKGQLATWEAKLKLAEERIAIYKPLAEKGSVSREELLSALAAKGEAIGGIDTAKGKILEAELNIQFCKIKAPISGVVGEALLTKGDLANASGSESLLTTIVAVDPMYVKFNVNESAVRQYQKLMRERSAKNKEPAKERTEKIPVEMALVGDVGFPHKGYVDFIDNRVDSATSSQMIRARFDNPKGPDNRRVLTAGMFARVRASISDPYPAILVADRAILTDQSLKYVLVVDKSKKNVVERVDVTVSERLQESGLRAVEAGLKGDEWIIVDGVNRARPGVTVTPTEGTMPRRPEIAQPKTADESKKSPSGDQKSEGESGKKKSE